MISNTIKKLQNKLAQEHEIFCARHKRPDVVSWLKEQVPEARYFLTLTFAEDVDWEQAQKSAKTFHHEVSRAIAGKRATKKGRYIHPIAIVAEQQKCSRRWHLHILMGALPAEYDRIIFVDDLKIECAKMWQRFRYLKKPTEKRLFLDQRKNSVEDESAKIAGEHSAKWFIELMTDEDVDKCFEYITKTYPKEGSDFFVVTY